MGVWVVNLLLLLWCLHVPPPKKKQTLPTYGYARMYSGVSLDSFLKKITVQQLSKEGLAALGPTVAHMAAVEGLDAHRRAVTLRLGLD